MLYQCPCCDYFVFETRGDYIICLICFWEDDGIDIDKIDQHSGPNKLTLREARQNFKVCGASDEKFQKNIVSIKERKKYKVEYRLV